MTSALASALTDLDLLFKGFADPTRIRIVNLLVAGELCVCDLVELLGVPQSTVSRHLRYLHRSESYHHLTMFFATCTNSNARSTRRTDQTVKLGGRWGPQHPISAAKPLAHTEPGRT